ncbi:MAG: hypothetical protein J6O73_19120 [Lachnospiraceae bacterium]|nr:hypothetical protein [Lachnospiraceae bacterium]MBO6209018.1 hypothetical protein [Lachnospiraceae bacterium]
MDIVEGVKDELFNDVEEDYHQRLEEEYKKHLSGTLNKIELNDSNYKSILMDEIELNNKVLGDYAGPFKLALYLYDESFEELNSLSLTGYHLALDRLKNNVTIDAGEVNKNIERMDKLFNEVEPFNIFRAQEAYSEGIEDYEYAGGRSDGMSFRLSHNLP